MHVRNIGYKTMWCKQLQSSDLDRVNIQSSITNSNIFPAKTSTGNAFWALLPTGKHSTNVFQTFLNNKNCFAQRWVDGKTNSKIVLTTRLVETNGFECLRLTLLYKSKSIWFHFWGLRKSVVVSEQTFFLELFCGFWGPEKSWSFFYNSHTKEKPNPWSKMCASIL